jgi:N-acetylglucosamine kinase-like BadF-type ATPase
VAIGREDLRVLGRAEGPAAAMKPGGAAAAAAVIADTARRAAGDVLLPAAHAVIGAAGAGRSQEQADLARAVIAAGVAETVRVLPDGEVALRAAFAEGAGIIVNAGTGSVAFARDPAGGMHRSGGHGWQFGDEGGGYWLGRRALDAAARAQDGRAEGSTLLARLLGALGLRQFDDLVRWSTTATPAQVAALAPHVLNAASEGEAIARRTVTDAAEELAGLAVALARHFPGSGPIAVAATGGLVNPASALTTALRDALAVQLPRAELSTRHIDLALGALALAAAAR